jgi:hypothetical protein
MTSPFRPGLVGAASAPSNPVVRHSPILWFNIYRDLTMRNGPFPQCAIRARLLHAPNKSSRSMFGRTASCSSIYPAFNSRFASG